MCISKYIERYALVSYLLGIRLSYLFIHKWYPLMVESWSPVWHFIIQYPYWSFQTWNGEKEIEEMVMKGEETDDNQKKVESSNWLNAKDVLVKWKLKLIDIIQLTSPATTLAPFGIVSLWVSEIFLPNICFITERDFITFFRMVRNYIMKNLIRKNYWKALSIFHKYILWLLKKYNTITAILQSIGCWLLILKQQKIFWAVGGHSMGGIGIPWARMNKEVLAIECGINNSALTFPIRKTNSNLITTGRNNSIGLHVFVLHGIVSV